MRIAFDTFNLGVIAGSGNKTYTVELIKALCDLQTGDEWQLVTYWRKKAACAAIFGEHPRRVIKAMFPHPRLLGDAMTGPVQAIASLSGMVLAGQCDLFHCTNPINFPSCMPRVVTTVHDLIAFRDEPWVTPGSKRYYAKNLGRIVRSSLVLFANSEYTAGELLGRFPSAAGRLLVTPLAAGPWFAPGEKDRAFLKRFGISDCERPYLLTVGELQRRKNISGMLKAFESLDHRCDDVRFVIIGQVKDGAMSKDILKEINGSPKRDRIHLLHTVSNDDLALFYSHATGFVFYSFFEGFGLPVIEAMACGCPVAAADNSSLTEIAKGAALLVDEKNMDSMRDGMERLIEDEGLRNDLRKKGLERAKGYSWKRTAQITYRGYKMAHGIA
jgi:glycosyltransferase involved in cell wall biosynthesis